MTPVVVVEAGSGDVASWLEIVQEVEPLFGPMPQFVATLTRNIDRATALCVRDGADRVLGGVLLREPPNAHIAWLAVRNSARGRGVGHALVAEALRRYSFATEVTVDTFGEDNLEGRPARRLYESFGFVPAEHLERGPEGGTRQRFRLSQQGENFGVTDRWGFVCVLDRWAEVVDAPRGSALPPGACWILPETYAYTEAAGVWQRLASTIPNVIGPYDEDDVSEPAHIQALHDALVEAAVSAPCAEVATNLEQIIALVDQALADKTPLHVAM